MSQEPEEASPLKVTIGKPKPTNIHFEFVVKQARSVFQLEVLVKRPKREKEFAGVINLNADELSQLERDLQSLVNYTFTRP